VPSVSLLLWDVGGVLLSNGWDQNARAAAAAHFDLDATEFERRHALVEEAFETGRLDWEGYLAATVFYAPRSFTPEAFRQFMREQSQRHAAALRTARSLRDDGRYVMAALNNESLGLNEYRIRTFGLAEVFHVFFSSCYTGHRKPEPAAYRFALQFTQRTPEETLFLDDRPENIAAAARLGLRTLTVQDPGRLREELALAGVASK
jgi:putative hydrolase of the HAD superfamily